MRAIWAIQKALISDDDSRGMKEAMDQLDVGYRLIDIIPFSDDIPNVDYDGPIIPYGGTKFIEKARHIKPWVFFFNDNFRYHIYLNKYGKYMFNCDGTYMKMKDFSPRMFDEDEYFFIRPDKDIKEFAGNVIKPIEFMSWYKKIERRGFDINEDTEIIVAKASRIDNEWRLYIVDGNVVGGSRYRQNHNLSISSEVPERVFDFAKEMISIWEPSKVFVMDICETNNELSILELGDLHSCGWYNSNKKDIIKAVTEYVENRPMV